MVAQFKAFIDPSRFNYDRYFEKNLAIFRKAAESEGYMNDSVAAAFDALGALLHHDLEHDLDINTEEITEILEAELGKRYFSEGDNVRRTLSGDSTVILAGEIINDGDRYRSILRP